MAPMSEVIQWVLQTCSQWLEEATGSMKIRGFSDDFGQFIVKNPTPRLQAEFASRNRGSDAVLMFHGTPIKNLGAILQNGFKPGGTWVAEEPGFSVGYALKEATGLSPTPRAGALFGGINRNPAFHVGLGENPQALTPHDSYGALFGCESLDPVYGSYQFPGLMAIRKTSVTQDARAVMVRYVFLVPLSA